MDQDSDPFVFPDMPDEAVAAIHEFLEELYLRFQNHYFAQMHRWYHELDEPRGPPRSEALTAAQRSAVLRTRK